MLVTWASNACASTTVGALFICIIIWIYMRVISISGLNRTEILAPYPWVSRKCSEKLHSWKALIWIEIPWEVAVSTIGCWWVNGYLTVIWTQIWSKITRWWSWWWIRRHGWWWWRRRCRCWCQRCRWHCWRSCLWNCWWRCCDKIKTIIGAEKYLSIRLFITESIQIEIELTIVKSFVTVILWCVQ